MLNHPADKIRESFREYVAQRVTIPADAIMLETTLIRDGMYCGRRFALEGYCVVYFVEEQQIKMYSPAGTVEFSCPLATFLSPPSQSIAA
ncbi:MAG: hypothetical protein MUD03_01460 [Pirellula sp.]|jgi:hypothetical protein|nr:hypothetical protein [Pirellula sp.]